MQQQLHTLLHDILSDSYRGSLSISLYETCTVLASSLPSDLKQRLLDYAGQPDYLNILVQSQNADGSWREDNRLFYLPDALISTTAAVLALLTNDTVPINDPIIQKATDFISQNSLSALMMDDMKKTIGFESLLVANINRLMGMGLSFDLDAAVLSKLNMVRDMKLQKKLAHLYDANLTIHSVLDAFADKSSEIDWERLSEFQESNGSMGIYASSTVQLLENLDSSSASYQQGVDYLFDCAGTTGFTPFSPSDQFEIWWALYMLGDSPLSDEVAAVVQTIADIPDDGIAVTNSFSLADVDTTAMKIAALQFLGHEVNISPIHSFFDGQAYQCYRFENRLSVSANIHALVALSGSLDYRDEIEDEPYRKFMSSLNYVLDELQNNQFEDKWHLSNLYTTCHTMEFFVNLIDSSIFHLLPEATREVIFNSLQGMAEYAYSTYDGQGGFGEQNQSTVEETAYVTSALIKTTRVLDIVLERDLLIAIQHYLNTHTPEMDIPLWLGKTLYKSRVITEAAKLSALAWIEHYLNLAQASQQAIAS